ncbi:uncharacterized protein SPAPADRAFT_54332 [Spathaspora passalidarum NRRL Y-27907]|uniref:Armadillo-like helical domain-containing protein n=1 Tax=Spathaspora passalidarum (strain NRRL Y-27907 / 11-Y1) TaxID=619300 RepID=G3AHI3_SPAPN|nr:uncharacterized protein SPAPADRAFT_54332 [Spathaspora passalidarum NRRL Y-27907]EGW34147.1 hypothetical protein SPAPADRAFT_54332 [Spathaspora passalidarum NRRL Y-27907]
MNQRYQERLYSDIFNRDNDETFYRSLFTTPINKNVLLEAFGSIIESDEVSSTISGRKLSVLQHIFQTGLAVYADAIGYIDQEQVGVEPLDQSVSVDSIFRRSSLLDIDGDDITELSGKSSKNSSRQVLEFNDGDDLTSLHGQTSTSQLTEEQSSRSATTTPIGKHESEFDNLNPEVKADLIINILRIFHLWFKNIINTNEKLKGTNTSFGLTTRVDLSVSLFSGGLDVLSLVDLITKVKWYLKTTLQQIQSGESVKLPVIKESLLLLTEILKSIYTGLVVHPSSSGNYHVLKSLLFTFYQVNLANEIQSIITITQPFKNGDKYEPPKVILSIDTLFTLHLLVGVLVNIPTSLLPTHLNSSDITALSIQSLNPYKSMPLFARIYDWELFQSEINSRLLPIFCMEFNYCYKFRPDLMLDKIKTNSIFNWLNLSTDAYVHCNTVETYTTLSNPKLNLLEGQDEFLVNLQHVYDHKISRISDKLDLQKLISVTLTIKSLIGNPSFVSVLIEQRTSANPEDLTEDELKNVELFEVWLCLLSYIFEYQYRSSSLQHLTTLSLEIILNLTTNYISDLKKYQINEDKWKLCHQKLPFVPHDQGDLGYKSSLFYILDCVQNLIRFNLTNKLNVKNYRLGVNLIHQILSCFEQDSNIDLGKYSWFEFHSTICTLVKFIDKQNLLAFKKLDSKQVRVLVEEVLVTIDFMLNKRFNQCEQVVDSESWFWTSTPNSINYSLIYNILLNFESFTRLINELELTNLTRLSRCMKQYESQFQLTETEENRINYSDLDYDSPEFVQKINEYFSQEEEPKQNKPDHKFQETLLHEGLVTDNDMITYIQTAFPVNF